MHKTIPVFLHGHIPGLFLSCEGAVLCSDASESRIGLSKHEILHAQVFDLRKLLPATPTYDFNIHVRFFHLLDVLGFINVEKFEDLSSFSNARNLDSSGNGLNEFIGLIRLMSWARYVESYPMLLLLHCAGHGFPAWGVLECEGGPLQPTRTSTVGRPWHLPIS
ncbi:hypothetical protein M758_10G032100 [Ceratodon purpureus]|nr:hypothetical protein M758_10G032100 [Ceratodon purpureus]